MPRVASCALRAISSVAAPCCSTAAAIAVAVSLTALMVYARRVAGPESDVKKRAMTDVVGIYWHFMDFLWVFLFLLLFFWR